MIYENKDQLKKGCESILAIEEDDVPRFRRRQISE